MHFTPAFVVQGELIDSIVCIVRHMAQGVPGMSVDGAAQTALHTDAQGAFTVQPQDSSS